MLSYTDALNMPGGQILVSTLSYGDNVECTYADAGTSSSVNCKKKGAPAVPAGTNSLLPAATSFTPAAAELAPLSTGNSVPPATNAADPATPAAAPTDTTSNSVAAEEPLTANAVMPADTSATNASPADNTAVPVEDCPMEEPAESDVTTALPGDNTVLPADDASVDYPAEEPADATATNALPAADAVVPAEHVSVNAPAADVASNTITNAVPAADTAVPVVPTPAADTAAATNVPVLAGDYNVAHGTPGYIVGGVKGAKDTFGKPVTADIPSGDVATAAPQAPAGSVSASTPPASPEQTITPSPVPDASPAAAATPSPATSSGPTWETAPVCAGQPTKQTSVQVCSEAQQGRAPSESNCVCIIAQHTHFDSPVTCHVQMHASPLLQSAYVQWTLTLCHACLSCRT
jgi:hypothetical protein